MAMQWQGLKLPVIILAFVLGLVLAFGGQWAYKQYNYQQPLNKILAENKQVEEFKVVDGVNERIIQVTLSKKASNFMEAHQELNQLIKDVLGKTPYRLEILSASDPSLEQAYYEIHHVVYQAQVTGNFPEVLNTVQVVAKNHGAEGKVFIDQNNIYIQMIKPEGHNLYKIIPRYTELNSLQGGA